MGEGCRVTPVWPGCRASLSLHIHVEQAQVQGTDPQSRGPNGPRARRGGASTGQAVWPHQSHQVSLSLLWVTPHAAHFFSPKSRLPKAERAFQVSVSEGASLSLAGPPSALATPPYRVSWVLRTLPPSQVELEGICSPVEKLLLNHCPHPHLNEVIPGSVSI